jgi:hypothetical protein
LTRFFDNNYDVGAVEKTLKKGNSVETVIRIVRMFKALVKREDELHDANLLGLKVEPLPVEHVSLEFRRLKRLVDGVRKVEALKRAQGQNRKRDKDLDKRIDEATNQNALMCQIWDGAKKIEKEGGEPSKPWLTKTDLLVLK